LSLEKTVVVACAAEDGVLRIAQVGFEEISAASGCARRANKLYQLQVSANNRLTN
jgi:hypothetical protein